MGMAAFFARLAACLLLIAPALSAATPNEVARFLAGLRPEDPELESLASRPEWTTHAAELDAAWAQLEKRQLTPIRLWRDSLLPSPAAAGRPLIYFFSGPDVLYAHSFFPEAPQYVLCGIEPVGTMPDPASLPPAQLSGGLRQLRQSLSSILSWSFFITKNMRTDLEASSLRGTTPILCLFLARHGCLIRSVEPVGFDKNGALNRSSPPFQGVEIRFQRLGEGSPNPVQTLFYFSADLSNGPIEKSGFLKWAGSLGPADAFVKSASYLMHTGDFTNVRKFLLENSDRILEDDSGIPLRHFDSGIWQIRALGAYPGPIELFKQFHQPDMESLYRRVYSSPLPFGFGYRWQPHQSSLILAEKRASLEQAARTAPHPAVTEPAPTAPAIPALPVPRLEPFLPSGR